MKDKILDFIRLKGPIFPTDISSKLGIESYFASAYLSEMVSKKEISISFMKVGSSPLYFLPTQKNLLENFSDKLNEKDKRAYDELKDQKVLRDSQLSPLLRVSLKNIKDFAIPLEVSFNNQKELFWKFYSVSAEETSEVIKKSLSGEPKSETKKEEIKEIPQEKTLEITKEKEIIEEEIKEQAKKESIKDREEIEKLKEEIEKLKKQKEVSKSKKETSEEKLVENTDLESFDIESRVKDTSDKFMKEVVKYLDDKKIEITDFEITKKNTEIDVFIKIPTTIGRVPFICKAKDKKRISDSDIDLVYASGVTHKLPVILLTKGELTKKAKEKLNNLKGMKVVNF